MKVQGITPVATEMPAAARFYTLVVLTLIYGLNFLDRTIFNILIEPIKAEFKLSDTALGLLAGFGFVVLYCGLGIPVARLADRTNRRNLVAVALAFWSAMTAACGFAQSALGLAMARVGVGVGEAAGTPASQAMIGDLFTREERPRALGIYAVGTYLGVFMGYFSGGWISHYYGWRPAFIAAGVPGIVLALVLWLTVREPARQLVGGPPAPATRIGPSIWALLATPTYFIVLLGFCATSLTNYSTSVWIPPFLARVHHLTSAEIGTYAGTFKGLFGMAGTLAGGVVTARLARRDDRWLLWAPAVMSGLAGPVFALCVLAPGFAGTMSAMALFSFCVGFHLGPIFSIGQTVPKPGHRALAAAMLVLCATLFGQGVGPLAVGAINDALRPAYGNDAIRYSLLLAAVASCVGALLFLVASRFIRRDLSATQP